MFGSEDVKKRFLIVLLIFTAIRFLLFAFLPQVQIKLNGNECITLEYGEKYEEKGAKGYYCNLFKCSYISNDIKMDEIEINKIGNYSVKYEIEYKGRRYHKARFIMVVDTEKPTISLIGEEKVYLPLGYECTIPGAAAVDNYDGDITGKIRLNGKVNCNKQGTYLLEYSVKDSSNNESKIEREVVVYEEKKNILIETKDENVKKMLSEIDSYIKNNKLSISVLYNDIMNGYTYTYNPNSVYYGCSLIKTLDAMYVYENMEVTDRLRTNVKKAIEVSDNDAHYSLVNTIGKSRLASYGKSLGAKYVLTTGDYYGNTTVYDQQVYMKHLFKLIYTLPNGSELIKFFSSNFKKYMDFEGAPHIIHKYGRISGHYFHESAIILDEHPYILTILTQEDDKKYIMTELSKKFYKLHRLLNEK